MITIAVISFLLPFFAVLGGELLVENTEPDELRKMGVQTGYE